MSQGKIVQIIGAVIDVEFPREAMPKVYDALKVDEHGLILEVQQQLGDGIVRTIAMGTTDGMGRDLSVTNTGQPINVPVGEKTLGRIMDVLGNPIDDKGPIKTKINGLVERPAPGVLDRKSVHEPMMTGLISVDAMGVRYAVGVNSKVLSKTIKDKKLKQELILKNGHTKLEVFAGIVLALVVSFAIFFVFGALV